MQNYRICLFGKFTLQYGDDFTEYPDSSRPLELLVYLLLNRQRVHPREVLAALLWSEQSTGQSKKYLRKVLWQLQRILETSGFYGDHALLDVDNEWIGVRQQSNIWLDVANFDAVCARLGGIPGSQLNHLQAQALQQAVHLYKGELLEGWYQDWCLLERERLQQIYLMALDKLAAYSETTGDIEAGLAYGAQILHYDRAREYTHCQLMRLYYLAGDRTNAIRQYERCVTALQEEMEIAPAPETVELYKLIRSNGRFKQESAHHRQHDTLPSSPNEGSLVDIVARLHTLQLSLVQMHNQIQTEIEQVDRLLKVLESG
jgi:DNA-binding SARP family transcriptional activator